MCGKRDCEFWTTFGCAKGDAYDCVMTHNKSKMRAEILDAAKEIICNDRNAQYGEPEDNFAEIAKLWSDYLDEDISAQDVAMMMTLFKIARIKTGGVKMDNYVDAAGYIACGGEISIKGGD